ncbi:MAG TPA: hypothetical protein VHK91_00735 [Flavisolibacter sp.]|jgi:hypothetical protein|nr:hypothetical protein [Flavisolibacter sp.]
MLSIIQIEYIKNLHDEKKNIGRDQPGRDISPEFLSDNQQQQVAEINDRIKKDSKKKTQDHNGSRKVLIFHPVTDQQRKGQQEKYITNESHP